MMSVNRKNGFLSPQCLSRIKKDIKEIYDEPPPGIFVVPDEKDLTLIHALVTGSFETPYEGGFFYFQMRCPANYPMSPPKVKNMTTGGGRVGFHPYLYKTGHVCLSILGTWEGPPWSPKQSICSVLLSIQSIMSENPYFTEIGPRKGKINDESDQYNNYIRHETLRVAVCGMLEGKNTDSKDCPQPLRDIMEKSFPEFYDKYESSARANLQLNPQLIVNPFEDGQGNFNFSSILKRLQTIKRKLDAK